MTFVFVPPHKPASVHAIKALQKFVDDFQKFFIITGAGISTESGIPDYRSEGVGRFARTNHRPVTIQDFLKSARTRQRYWARNYASWSTFSGVQPNISHLLLAQWEKYNRIQWLCTQNVDSLHHKAGSSRVTELHGSAYRVKCLKCTRLYDRHSMQDYIKTLNPDWTAPILGLAPDGDVDLNQYQIDAFCTPHCPTCGEEGILRPDVVFFGDNVPTDRVDFLMKQIKEADAILVLGSSLQTYSAYRFLIRAVDEEKAIGIVNIGKTRARDNKTVDLDLEARLGDVLPQIIYTGDVNAPAVVERVEA